MIIEVGKIYRDRVNGLVRIESYDENRMDYIARDLKWGTLQNIHYYQDGQATHHPDVFSLVEEVVRDPDLELVDGGTYFSALHRTYTISLISPEEESEHQWMLGHRYQYYTLVPTRSQEDPYLALYFRPDGTSNDYDILVRRLS